MSKGDKLIRSLRQLLEINRYRLRDKVGMCAIARHLQCFILTKTWLDGSELKIPSATNKGDCDK